MFLAVAAVWGVLAVSIADAKLLQGTDERCRSEGESITVAGITDDPCISCFCRGGLVECERHRCGSMDGCHAVLFERPDHSCCDVCKGCHHNGTDYPSGATWTDPTHPCRLYQCQAGVLTRTVEQCHVECEQPVHVPGECCPSCSDCFFEGVDRLNGETFQHSSSPSARCTCKAGRVTCSYRPCPVLNCPDHALHQPQGEPCPRCKGQRKIFSLPTSCFFAKRVYTQGTVITPDRCTSCTCWAGTIHCERESCPPAPCDVADHVYDNGTCCPRCKAQRDCFYGNKTYQSGTHWLRPQTCQQCRCDNGVLYCTRQTCPDNPLCPQGQSLKQQPDSCCPTCVDDAAVCSVNSNSYHVTFDGHAFRAHGTCRYLLSRDCKRNSFFVKIRNSPRSGEETWTEVVTVGLGGYTVHLHRTLQARVNRRRVQLPYRIASRFALQRIGNKLVLDAYQQIGLKVIWDGQSRLEVMVSEVHKDHLCGLCGNHNGDPADDLRDRRDKAVGSAAPFLQAWRVSGVCHRPAGPPASLLSALCRPTAAVRAQTQCGAFFRSHFAACAARIDTTPYIRWCLHDSCLCGGGSSCHLRSIRSLARRCKRAGFRVRWWRVV